MEFNLANILQKSFECTFRRNLPPIPENTCHFQSRSKGINS